MRQDLLLEIHVVPRIAYCRIERGVSQPLAYRCHVHTRLQQTVLSATTAVAPRFGTASMIALVITGQVLSSLALDNFGLLGSAVQPLNFERVVAAALLIAGAAPGPPSPKEA